MASQNKMNESSDQESLSTKSPVPEHELFSDNNYIDGQRFGDCMVILDCDGRITYFSPMASLITGFSQSEVAFKHYTQLDLVAQKDMPLAIECFQTLCGGTSIEPQKLELIAKSGEKIPAIIESDLIFKGNQVGAIRLTLNLSQPDQDKKSIYNNFFDNSLLGVFRSRLSDGKIIKFNHLLMKKIGFDDPVDFSEHFYFPKYYVNKLQRDEIINTLKISGVIENQDVQLYTKSNETIWVKLAARANFEQGYMEGIAIDITAQKLAEQQLKEMARFPQENPFPVIRVNKEGIITYTNAASEPLLSIWNTAVGGMAPSVLLDTARKALAAGKDVESELECDKRIFLFLFSPSPELRDVNIYGQDITDRINFARAIQASEDNYHTIFNAVNDAVFVHNPVDGIIIDVNQRTCEMYGYSRDEIIGMNFHVNNDLASPYSAKEARIFMDKTLSEGPQIFDWRTRKKNGQLVWVEVNLKKATIGGRECLLSVVRDIDRRKRMEQLQEALLKITEAISSTENLPQLLQSIHHILGALIDTSDFYIALYDHQTGHYTFPYHVNPTGSGDFSRRPLRKRITDYVRRTGKSLFARGEEFARLTAQGEIDLAGIPQPKVWLGVPLQMAEDVIGVVSVQSYDNPNLYDENDLELLEHVSKYLALAISRKQAAEALRLSEEKYRSLVYAVPDGIVITDLDENIKYINPAACDIFGYSLEELLDVNLTTIILPDDIEFVRNQTEKRRHLERSCYHFKIINKNGQTRKIYISAAPILDESGNVVNTMGIFRDVTDIEKAEIEKQDLRDKLARAQRMESLGLLAGGVAHDLNNILGPLVAYPELIRMKLPPDSPILDKITKIETSAQRAAGVVQDLLTMARRGRFEMYPIYLNEIINSYLESTDFNTLKQQNPKVKLELCLTDVNPVVLGSNSHLSKMVMNLVINAFDAMPHGGSLKLTTQIKQIDKLADGYDNIDAGMYALFTVTDTGFGIDPKDIKRIFEPFYTKKQLGRSGSGLGLSIVYGVIKDHNGYIDVQSVVAEGSRFTIYLPILDKIPGTQAAPAIDIHGTETILVVDDTVEQRELAQVILTSLGYKVRIAANGREGIAALKSNPADLVVLDMIMDGDFDGLDTYREMIKINPGQKAIITSGYAETDRVRAAEKLGVGKYIRKPYTLQKLGRAIRELLDQKAD